MIFITLKQNLAATPEQVSSTLLDHARLNRFFNARFLLLNYQNDGEIKGGAGSLRQVKTVGSTFNELIVSANNSHISYQIVGDKPVANHRGDIYFFAVENSVIPMSEVNYHIRCSSLWWLPDFIVKYFIEKNINHALKNLKSHFKERAL
jgi:hypothetical protein